jgi:hypothetical protein
MIGFIDDGDWNYFSTNLTRLVDLLFCDQWPTATDSIQLPFYSVTSDFFFQSETRARWFYQRSLVLYSSQRSASVPLRLAFWKLYWKWTALGEDCIESVLTSKRGNRQHTWMIIPWSTAIPSRLFSFSKNNLIGKIIKT